MNGFWEAMLKKSIERDKAYYDLIKAERDEARSVAIQLYRLFSSDSDVNMISRDRMAELYPWLNRERSP